MPLAVNDNHVSKKSANLPMRGKIDALEFGDSADPILR
jgi:hypothetical protein